MVAAPGLIVIDTPIFVIDLRYRRDRYFAMNRSFLSRISEEGKGATTIFNLLEVCGILSFNLGERELKELFHYFAEHYKIEVLPHGSFESALPVLKTEDVFGIITRKMGFGDALIVAAIEKSIPQAGQFVSWNARHFRGRLAIPVLTPREFLDKSL